MGGNSNGDDFFKDFEVFDVFFGGGPGETFDEDGSGVEFGVSFGSVGGFGVVGDVGVGGWFVFVG